MIKFIKWLIEGRTYKTFCNYYCKDCGIWWDRVLEIPSYKSVKKVLKKKNWGFCPNGKGCKRNVCTIKAIRIKRAKIVDTNQKIEKNT